VRRRDKKRRKKQKKQKKQREEKDCQASTFAKEDQDTLQRNKKKQESVTEEEYSMWSCRRCTLENRLEDSICQACGGSRLSSIGEVHLEDIEDPVQLNIPQLTKVEDDPVDWTCVVCTLTNPPLVRYCDACNAENPLHIDQDIGAPVREMTPERKDQMEKAARYIGIGLITGLLVLFLVNVVFSLCTYIRSSLPDVGSLSAPDFSSFKPAFQLPATTSTSTTATTSTQQDPDLLSEELQYLDFDFYGLNILLFSCLLPFFVVMAASA